MKSPTASLSLIHIYQVAANLRLPEVTSAIVIDPVRETQIIVLHVEDPNPALATAIANDLPEVFIAQNEKQQQQRFNTCLLYTS